MNILRAVKHTRIVFVLACLAALVAIFISESSYRQSVGMQQELVA